VETTEQKGKRRKKPHKPKPVEQEGMPQYQHCPYAKHREDKNPKYHEDQRRDVARIVAVHPPKTVEWEHKWINERNVACGHTYESAMNESPLHPCHGIDELPPKLLDVLQISRSSPTCALGKKSTLPIIEIEIEIVHNNTSKLDRLLSIGPIYLAIQD
jgi:hypothetical protein